MFKQNKQAFTLVELIVVITILAILWTIAFISLQWYSASARDSRRISDISNIKKSLELFSINTWKYPMPDSANEATFSWSTIWTQWTVWDNITTNLSRNLNKKPLDPLTEIEYTYSATYSQTEYELLAIYESDIVSYNYLNQANAATQTYPKIDWTYNWVAVKTPKYIIPTPSIINVELYDNTIELGDWTITSQIITWWDNIINSQNTQTWELNIDFQYYEIPINWVIDKEELWTIIQNTYTWSSLANEWIYESILTTTDFNELVTLVEQTVLNTIIESSIQLSNNWWWEEGTNLIWWRTLDPNCDIDDIQIWNQTWAWCNSTLWDWLEFGQRDVDIGTDNYNGYVWSNCRVKDENGDFKYCTIWDITMKSNTKANTWNTEPNLYWDEEFANIWWKFYTWNNFNSACPVWRHVPSDNDWEILETNLNWWINCRNAEDWWRCDWLGWKTNVAYDPDRKLAEILKIPLSGYRDVDHMTFNTRWYYAVLWASTDNWAHMRLLCPDLSDVYRTNYSTRSLSVRCIKDN